MCLNPDWNAKRSFLRNMKREGRKTFEAWKIFTRSGCGLHTNKKYGPGVHHAVGLKKRYDRFKPRGIHVYVDRPTGLYFDCKLVKVVCHVDDLIAIEHELKSESRGWAGSRRQAVLRKIRILRKDWEMDSF